jgi:hypothetical protein
MEAMLGKLLKIIVAIAIVVAIPKIIIKVFFTESKSEIAKHMTDLAAKENQGVPKKIDEATTLTKVEFDKDLGVFRTHYTVAPDIYIDQKKEDFIRETTLVRVCGGAVKEILKKNVTIEYLYAFNAGGIVKTVPIVIKLDACK